MYLYGSSFSHFSSSHNHFSLRIKKKDKRKIMSDEKMRAAGLCNWPYLPCRQGLGSRVQIQVLWAGGVHSRSNTTITSVTARHYAQTLDRSHWPLAPLQRSGTLYSGGRLEGTATDVTLRHLRRVPRRPPGHPPLGYTRPCSATVGAVASQYTARPGRVAPLALALQLAREYRPNNM